MEIQKYRVVFSGDIVEGQNIDDVKSRVAKLYKTKITHIEKYFNGETITIKDQLDFEQCSKIQEAFLKRGAVCKIEPCVIDDVAVVKDEPVIVVQENKEQFFNDNSLLSDLKKQKSFPFVLLNIKNYDGAKFLMLIIFVIGCWFFGSAMIRLLNWQDKWFVPDTAVKAIYFFYHLLQFTIIYCLTWLVFDRKGIEGYVLSLFSIIFGIVYVLSPVDFVPEAIPFIGTTDDLFVGASSIIVGVRSWYNNKNKNELSSELAKLIENGDTEKAMYKYLKSEGYKISDEI